jgi:hypothetical protein
MSTAAPESWLTWNILSVCTPMIIGGVAGKGTPTTTAMQHQSALRDSSSQNTQPEPGGMHGTIWERKRRGRLTFKEVGTDKPHCMSSEGGQGGKRSEPPSAGSPSPAGSTRPMLRCTTCTTYSFCHSGRRHSLSTLMIGCCCCCCCCCCRRCRRCCCCRRCRRCCCCCGCCCCRCCCCSCTFWAAIAAASYAPAVVLQLLLLQYQLCPALTSSAHPSGPHPHPHLLHLMPPSDFSSKRPRPSRPPAMQVAKLKLTCSLRSST